MSNLENLRIKKLMSQAELAKKVGVTQQSISKWETGLTYPRIPMAMKLAGILGCTVDEILRDECNAEKQKTTA